MNGGSNKGTVRTEGFRRRAGTWAGHGHSAANEGGRNVTVHRTALSSSVCEPV